MRQEIVYARKDRKDPTIGPVAIMVAMETDVALVRRYMGVRGRPARRIMNSSLYKAKHRNQSISIVGPMLGAPHAVMILEKLIVLGAKKILFLGWCGSVQENVQIADIVVPDSAMIGEGTSGYYALGNVGPRPSKGIVKAIEDSLEACSIPFSQRSRVVNRCSLPRDQTEGPFASTGRSARRGHGDFGLVCSSTIQER